MRLKAIFAIGVVVALVAVSCVLVFAETAPKVIAVKGDPKIMKKDSGSWASLSAAMAVDNGDRIKTAAGEAVEMMFFADKSNIVNVGENSDVVIVKGGVPCSIELLNGEAMALIKKLPKGSSFEVKTPAGISGARGTGWGSRTDGERATFDSYENSIYVKGIDRSGKAMEGELVVDEGFRTVVDRFERPERLEKLTGADMDRWNSWREEASGRAAEATREKTEESRAGQSQQLADDTRDKLDKAAREETQMERLETKKQDISETRDIQRIEERLETKESVTSGVCTSG